MTSALKKLMIPSLLSVFIITMAGVVTLSSAKAGEKSAPGQKKQEMPAEITFNGVEGPVLKLDRPYRYANQKCDFSFQMPESPATEVLWSEAKIPYDIFPNPGAGEVGEKVSYGLSTYDGSSFFSISAYCLYPSKESIDSLNAEKMKNIIKKISTKLNLKGVNAGLQRAGKGILIGSMEGLQVQSDTQYVTRYHFQVMKGLNSFLLITVRYSGDQPQFKPALTFLKDSMILESR